MSTWLVAAGIILFLPLLAAFVAGVVLRNQVQAWTKASRKRGKRLAQHLEAVE